MPPELRPARLPEGAAQAIDAWNLMGGEIQWAALDVVAELLGVEDVEGWIVRLVTIRNSQRAE